MYCDFLLERETGIELMITLFSSGISVNREHFCEHYPKTFSCQKLPRDLFVRLIDDVPEP